MKGETIEEGPENKCGEDAQEIFGVECFDRHKFIGVEHKETCEHDEEGDIPTGDTVESHTLEEP